MTLEEATALRTQVEIELYRLLRRAVVVSLDLKTIDFDTRECVAYLETVTAKVDILLDDGAGG